MEVFHEKSSTFLARACVSVRVLCACVQEALASRCRETGCWEKGKGGNGRARRVPLLCFLPLQVAVLKRDAAALSRSFLFELSGEP